MSCFQSLTWFLFQTAATAYTFPHTKAQVAAQASPAVAPPGKGAICSRKLRSEPRQSGLVAGWRSAADTEAESTTADQIPLVVERLAGPRMIQFDMAKTVSRFVSFRHEPQVAQSVCGFRGRTKHRRNRRKAEMAEWKQRV